MARAQRWQQRSGVRKANYENTGRYKELRFSNIHPILCLMTNGQNFAWRKAGAKMEVEEVKKFLHHGQLLKLEKGRNL